MQIWWSMITYKHRLVWYTYKWMVGYLSSYMTTEMMRYIYCVNSTLWLNLSYRLNTVYQVQSPIHSWYAFSHNKIFISNILISEGEYSKLINMQALSHYIACVKWCIKIPTQSDTHINHLYWFLFSSTMFRWNDISVDWVWHKRIREMGKSITFLYQQTLNLGNIYRRQWHRFVVYIKSKKNCLTYQVTTCKKKCFSSSIKDELKERDAKYRYGKQHWHVWCFITVYIL